MQRNFEPMRRQIEAWQRSELTDVTAKVVIYEAFVEGRHPRWHRGREHSKFLARAAYSLLSLRDQHEVLRRLHIQLRTVLMANHHCFSTAALAHALIWCAEQNPLDARKIRRQFLAARMFARSLRPAIHWRALTLRLHYHFTHVGLKLELFHLRAGELFAARSILLDRPIDLAALSALQYASPLRHAK
jgi:hypothetical protein